MGLDEDIIDPDKGANIARKLERLQESGVNEVAYPNLRSSPVLPNEGWTSNLADLPFVSFASLYIYRHFVKRPTNVILLADEQTNLYLLRNLLQMTLKMSVYHHSVAWERNTGFSKMAMCNPFNIILCPIVLGCVMLVPKSCHLW